MRQRTFAQNVWCVFDCVHQGLPHMNNHVRAWHNCFQQTLGFAYQTEYNLFEALRLEHTNIENRVTRIDAGHRHLQPSAGYKHKDERLRKIVQNFFQISILDYFCAVAHNGGLNI